MSPPGSIPGRPGAYSVIAMSKSLSIRGLDLVAGAEPGRHLPSVKHFLQPSWHGPFRESGTSGRSPGTSLFDPFELLPDRSWLPGGPPLGRVVRPAPGLACRAGGLLEAPQPLPEIIHFSSLTASCFAFSPTAPGGPTQEGHPLEQPQRSTTDRVPLSSSSLREKRYELSPTPPG
jgi:hypothetical protein